MFLLIVKFWYLATSIGMGLTLLQATRIGMIAYLFTYCGFGVIGGETARALYVSPFAKNNMQVISCVIWDRFIGVLSLSTLVMLGLFVNSSQSIPERSVLFAIFTIFIFFCLTWQFFIAFASLSLFKKKTGYALNFIFMALLCTAFVFLVKNTCFIAVYIIIDNFHFAASLFFISLCISTWFGAFLALRSDHPSARLHFIHRLNFLIRENFIFKEKVHVFFFSLLMALIAHIGYIAALFTFFAALSGGTAYSIKFDLLSAPVTFLMNILPFPAAGAGVNEFFYGYFMHSLTGFALPLFTGSFFAFRCALVMASLLGVPFYFASKK
jgi:hypothetical protein